MTVCISGLRIRFGHTNRLSSLADAEEEDDYILGLLAFPIFMACFFLTWGLVVLLLKWVGGSDRVGCAAGGEIVDVKALREQGVRRWERRQRIVRSWRLQYIFGICSIELITFSFVFANRGLTPFMASLEGITTVTSLILTRIQHGMHLGHLLSSQMESFRPFLGFNITALCPNYEQTILDSEFSLAVTAQEIVNSGQEMDYFFEHDIDSFLNGIAQVADTCQFVDEAIVKTKENEWIFRAFLIAANVINIFLLLSVVLTHNKIKWKFFHSLLGEFLVPAFAATAVIGVLILCTVTVGAMINADFCSGGEGSPLGTLAELVASSGYRREGFVNLVLDYYTKQQCEGANPLVFLQDLKTALEETSGRVDKMSRTFQNADFVSLSQKCGADFGLLNSTFYDMAPALSDLSQSVERLIDLSRCEQISPVLEDLAHGTICNDTMTTVSWMYYTLLVLALVIMTMLGIRAALFNTLIPGSKKKRREKEFRQYKRFMQEVGFDTTEWQMDPPKKVDPSHEGIVQINTFDTDETGSLSPKTSDENEDGFNDEPRLEGRAEPEAHVTDTLQDNSNDSEEDAESIISADSDDSSLNPPPSVVHSVASSLTASFSSALRMFQVWTDSSTVNMTFDTAANAHQHERTFDTPKKYPANILGPMDGSQDESGEAGDPEIVPLSPSAQPSAPKKSQKALRRTRGSAALT